MCLVKVRGVSREIVSCTSRIADGMEIETHTAAIEDARRMNLRMLARKYPAKTFLDSPDKPFLRLARHYGLEELDFNNEVNGTGSTTRIRSSASPCRVASITTLVCRSAWVGVRASLAALERMFVLRAPLEDKSALSGDAAVEWTKTVCPHCGTGCEINVCVSNAR